MALSDEELEQLRNQIRQELEQEHQAREDRAQRKAERRYNRHKETHEHNKEVENLRSEMRLDFYKSNGYEEKVDPTGRKMYLSPSEIENKQRKKRRKSGKKNISISDFGQFPIYVGVAILGIVVAVLLVKAM